MIKSMTGYGKDEILVEGKKLTVEIRSLNSKQLDLTVKLPSLYRPYEYEIRSRVSKALQRGKVDVFISVELQENTTPTSLNKELFSAYLNEIRAATSANRIDPEDPLTIGHIIESVLRMPDVVRSENITPDPEEALALNRSVDMAIEAIGKFRKQEGEILIADLLKRIDTIENLKNSVTPFEKQRTETIKARILESLATLGVNVDMNRLEQEMIYYIEKLDITEEKVRLQNHCDYFREVAHSEEGVGRKLGFISQEMGREINTMGSKSNEANMQKIVVQMKDELEKIKEQLLNIL